ncbi:MAG: class I SAM-dependent methyltransferase [Nanoarchaeota archaeon]
MTKEGQEKDIESLVHAILRNQSVGGNKKAYMRVVKQYPGYLPAHFAVFQELTEISKKRKGSLFHRENLDIVEWGPGTGLFAELAMLSPHIESYLAVEPCDEFAQQVEQRVGDWGNVVREGAEHYFKENSADAVVALFSYHHIHDKRSAIRNARTILRPDTYLIIVDGFLPEYETDKDGKPKDQRTFLDAVATYHARQIEGMGSLDTTAIKDQLYTYALESMGQHEFKVPLSVLRRQLEERKFEIIKDESIGHRELGYRLIVAKNSIL